MTPRELDVRLDARCIGRLSEVGDLWAFAYDDAWREAADGFDLAPALPRRAGRIADGASQRPVQWFFDNLLPEEGARRLLAGDAGLGVDDAFGLLQHYGRESAGALTLLPPGEVQPEGGLRPLPDPVLSARIRALPRLPLSHDAPKRMSLAGAQHKLAVVLDGGTLYEPVGGSASTHLLKPDHDDTARWPHSAANEWFVMRLAAAVGLPVPEVALRRVPEPVFLVRRFDRIGHGAAVQRRHAIDACQLLGLAPAFKYSQASAANLARVAEACRQTATTRQALLRWWLFNLLVGNTDAHLKNLSLMPEAGGLVLAPHYDLLSTAAYRDGAWGHEPLVTPAGNATRAGDVRREHVVAFGAELRLPPRLVLQQLDAMLDQVPARARELLTRFEADARGPAAMGEARLLRQIVHGPIEDMRRQLAAPGKPA